MLTMLLVEYTMRIMKHVIKSKRLLVETKIVSYRAQAVISSMKLGCKIRSEEFLLICRYCTAYGFERNCILC